MIRALLAAFRRGEGCAAVAAEKLGLVRTRFYELYGDYLRAAARPRAPSWTPGTSGGDLAPDWPSGTAALLRKLLATQPPAPTRRAAPLAGSQRRALWQRAATPHRGFPGYPKNYPLWDLRDDCSRVGTGTTIYHNEDLLAHFDFLPTAFTAHGLPLEL